jgi:hypothetical protein
VPEERLPGLVADLTVAGGRVVYEVARIDVPGSVLTDLPYNAYAERIAATAAVLQSVTPVIYEASFRTSQVYVSVAILGEPVGGRQRHTS